jgi:hypothetical protein
LDYVASKPTLPNLQFANLKYKPGQFNSMMVKLYAKTAKLDAHKQSGARLG